MLCSRPFGAGGAGLAAREVHNGVRIRRLPIGGSGSGLVRRTWGYLQFHLAAAWTLLRSRWADVTVTLTTPPLLGLWGTLSRRLGGPLHVTFIMDHHPDAEFESGLVSRHSVIGRLFEALYGWTLRGADRCVTLGPRMDERARRRGVLDERLAIIPIWSRADEVVPVPHESNELRRELGFDGRFIVLYAGNAGRVHRFDELCHAMKQLAQEAPEVHFAFVGGGPRHADLRAFVETHDLGNVTFGEPVPRARLAELLSAGDLHVSSLAPEQCGVAVPCKLYGQLAAGRPALFIGPRDCETALDLQQAGAGEVFEPDQGPELARAILRLARDPERCAELGRRGRNWFLEHRERRASVVRWQVLLEDLVGVERAQGHSVQAA